jgi:hypothetical protein
MNKIPLRIRLGALADETSEYCHWHVSEKHFLESWSDGRAHDGTVSLVQPLIQPLYDSHNAHEVVQLFFRENFDKTDHDILKEFWQRQNVSSGNAGRSAAVAAPPGNNATANGAGNSSSTATSSANNASKANLSAAATSVSNAQPSAANVAGTTTAGTSATTQNQSSSAAFEDRWKKYVHDGMIPNTQAPTKTVTASPAFLSQPMPASQSAGEM